MKAFALTLASVAALAVAAPASAVQLATTVSADGAYSGDINTLNDGVIPPLGQWYNIDTVHDYGATSFTFDFGGVKTVTDVLASVDNNDDYMINFYNGASFVISFNIPAWAGSVAPSPGGMDTFASFAAGNGATQLGGSALFQADHATIVSSGGDGFYGIGEVQFFNSRAVPEPASWAMMIGGFALAGGAMRRSRKAVSFA